MPPTSIKEQGRHSEESWKMALDVLSQAQHLRFIGFSLQEVDSSVRYLLKASCLDADEFETIDVICKDDDGEVQKRFEKFFKGRVRLRRAKFNDFVSQMYVQFIRDLNPEPSPAQCLEDTHQNFMATKHGNPSMVAV